MDLFRMRCYLASLQGGELPNPKSLLAAASRPSKLALGRLGIFSVSSFHALVSTNVLFMGVSHKSRHYYCIYMWNCARVSNGCTSMHCSLLHWALFPCFCLFLGCNKCSFKEKDFEPMMIYNHDFFWSLRTLELATYDPYLKK